MKKRTILLTILVALGSFRSFSQSLINTTWTVYDASYNFFLYFHFSTNTVSYSSDNISYTNVSTFQTSANSFTIVDLPTATCPGDTGRYTFLIQTNSLQFTLVNEACSSRQNTFVNFHWVRLIAGLKEKSLSGSSALYPNPTSCTLSIPFEGAKTIIVTDQGGKIVKTIKTDTKEMTLEDLATGVYIVNIFNPEDEVLTTQKIIRE
jgi:hypothetical protein